MRSSEHYAHIEGCTYPVRVGGLEWTQRYGGSGHVLGQRLVVASVVAIYGHLLDPDIDETDAIASLKRARQAEKEARD